MRQFMDQNGNSWIATAKKESTMDYKGRYYMYLHEENGSDAEGHALLDIRWNGEEVARRTLQAMSDVELRRRLRSAKGRS
ncbi:MAG: hypothetical protein OSA24_06130 [Longimicrobiales bacterium]|nr:hypothetical protein [Longimicrobiales bacterium]